MASFVTQADRAIETAHPRARIEAAFPEHAIVGEEYGTDAPAARCRWFIDPIDGTHNFMRGMPVFGDACSRSSAMGSSRQVS